MAYKDLSLEEKIKLLVGDSNGDATKTECLNGKVYQLQTADGPTGPHYTAHFTWLPSIANLACTWDINMVKQYVDAVADQCVLNGVDVLLGPSVNIRRVPLCGRNFEYMSEDPYLTGKLAQTYVSTLQSRGIAATMKHFCANNREYTRLYSSSDMDERTLREIYTKAFEMCIETANPWAIMCSYNAVNGVYMAENQTILRDLLRGELHYKNLIMSDWGAVRHRGQALAASLDLQMPFFNTDPYQQVYNSLEDGTITESHIDQAVTRLEELTEKVLKAKEQRTVKYSAEERHQLAVEVCRNGIVLLKNEGGILPLPAGKKIAVIGEQAIFPELCGGGSCNLADDPEGPYNTGFDVTQKGMDELLQERLPGAEVTFVSGYHAHKGFGLHYSHLHSPMVTKRAKDADIAIVFVGTNRVIECEGYDRDNLQLPSVQMDVLEETLQNNENVIVVLTAGSVVDVSAFKDRAKAILYTGFGGEGANEGIADVLVGKVSPSGKLTETFIKDVSVNPYLSSKGGFTKEEYQEKIFVGYRLYNTRNMEVEYPFGHGLSYTEFSYENLRIEQDDAGCTLFFRVRNVGKMAGKEICQVYVGKQSDTVERPAQELKGFIKVDLAAGESKEVAVRVDNKSLTYYNAAAKRWELESGAYTFMVAASSKDIRLEKTIEL